MDKESLLSQVNDGRKAAVMMNWMSPIFEEMEKTLLNSLKVNFRSGTYTELLLACHVAQLCAMDDLKNKIGGIANAGDGAAKTLSEQEESDVD